jgi:opacity protein-like surface antigen
MKRALRACALIAAIAAPAALSAQTSDKPVTFGVSGGLSLPLGDGSEEVNTGYNITGHLFYKPATLKSLRLRADVSFDRWDYDGIDANTRALGVTGNVVYDFPSSSTSMVRPYLIGGVGLYNSKASVDIGVIEGSTSDTNLGLQVGGGLTFQLSGFSTFAEAKFVNVLTEGGSTRFAPITFGVRF